MSVAFCNRNLLIGRYVGNSFLSRSEKMLPFVISCATEIMLFGTSRDEYPMPRSRFRSLPVLSRTSTVILPSAEHRSLVLLMPMTSILVRRNALKNFCASSRVNKCILDPLSMIASSSRSSLSAIAR